MALDWDYAQKAVIGAGLIDGGCVPEILAETRPEDYAGELRRYYEAFAALSADGKPVDTITVGAYLGPAYVDLTLALAKLTPTSANVGTYIQLCKEQARLSLLRQCGSDMMAAVSLEDARAALDKAAGISLDSARRTSWTAGELVQDWWEALNREEKPEYLSTGLGFLDATLRTVPGNYIIIAGYTSHGKSAMGLQMAWELSKSRKIGYFGFEGTRREWTNRLIAHVAEVPLRSIQDMELTQAQIRSCASACNEIDRRPLEFVPAAGYSVDDIRAETLRKGYQVVFVDYLQEVRGARDARKFGRVQEVGEISSGLQQMGLRYGVTIYAMSQLSRALKDKDEYVPLPVLSDLRESGQIEQDADAVVFVHAPYWRSFPAFRVMDLAKNRNGKKASFFADFAGEFQRFGPPTEAHARTYKRLMDAKRKTPRLAKEEPGFSEMREPEKDLPFTQQELPL